MFRAARHGAAGLDARPREVETPGHTPSLLGLRACGDAGNRVLFHTPMGTRGGDRAGGAVLTASGIRGAQIFTAGDRVATLGNGGAVIVLDASSGEALRRLDVGAAGQP